MYRGKPSSVMYRRKSAPLSKRDTEVLREVYKHLLMENCSFSNIGPSDDEVGRLPTNETEVTEFIKRRTRLWRESWILPYLKEMIDRAEEP